MPADFNVVDGLVAAVCDVGGHGWSLAAHRVVCIGVVGRARFVVFLRHEHAAGLGAVTLLTVAFPLVERLLEFLRLQLENSSLLLVDLALLVELLLLEV